MSFTTWAIKWTEFNKKEQIVWKGKEFKSIKARDSFIAKLEQKDNFNEIESWAFPDKEA